MIDETDIAKTVGTGDLTFFAQVNYGGGAGPGCVGLLAMAIATGQYRDSYLFHAPTNYTSNFVNITAPTGANVRSNRGPISACCGRPTSSNRSRPRSRQARC